MTSRSRSSERRSPLLRSGCRRFGQILEAGLDGIGVGVGVEPECGKTLAGGIADGSRLAAWPCQLQLHRLPRRGRMDRRRYHRPRACVACRTRSAWARDASSRSPRCHFCPTARSGDGRSWRPSDTWSGPHRSCRRSSCRILVVFLDVRQAEPVELALLVAALGRAVLAFFLAAFPIAHAVLRALAWQLWPCRAA
jgi:hypothetical protein